ncbi:MAG: nucleotidyltransferase domain-containing protein, partial [Thiohalorhabdaceae bacterium]
SRASDDARGGDLDLYIETGLSGEAVLDSELAFQRELQEALGEQRIDLTVHSRGRPFTAFEAHAREEGIRL